MFKSARNNKFQLPKNASHKASNVQFMVQHQKSNPMAHKPIVKSGIHLFFTLAFAGFIGLLSLSCESGMEEPVITISTFLVESGGIIYGDWTPIGVGFSAMMVEPDAGYLAEVVNVWDHNFMPVSGAAVWEDNTIYFSPLEKWKSGGKYTCRIHGTFSTQDGRAVGIRTELLFYVDADNEPDPTPPTEAADKEPDPTPPTEAADKEPDPIPPTEAADNEPDPTPPTEAVDNEPDPIPPTEAVDNEPDPTPPAEVVDKEPDPNPPTEVAEVFFLKKTEAGSYKETEYDADEYWNNVIRGECGLKILFTKEMDLSEPRSSLRIEPNRNYEAKAIDNRTLEVYFEAEDKPVKKITLTIKEDMQSLTGEKLRQDYDFTFTEWENDFEIVQFMVLPAAEFYGDEYCALPLDDLEQPFLIGAESDGKTKNVDFAYWFNSQIDELFAATDLLSKIKLVPDDTRISTTPYVSKIGMDYPNYKQTWAGLEFGTEDDTPYRYLLNIPGGIDGLNNGQGHFLKEDIIIKLDVIG
jgi:hypothetical protein